MKISAKCKCGLLGKWIEDPDTPFTTLEGSSTCIVALDGGVNLIVNFCPICGGRKLGSRRRGQECRCASISKWVKDPNVPVEYDQESDEYYLLMKIEDKLSLYCCLSCGGYLPKSKRGGLFTIPSTKEKAEIKARLKSVTKINDVVRILGEPDVRQGDIIYAPQKKKIYGYKDVKQTLIYTSLAKTLDLIVQEVEDGEIIFLFGGKQKNLKADDFGILQGK